MFTSRRRFERFYNKYLNNKDQQIRKNNEILDSIIRIKDQVHEIDRKNVKAVIDTKKSDDLQTKTIDILQAITNKQQDAIKDLQARLNKHQERIFKLESWLSSADAKPVEDLKEMVRQELKRFKHHSWEKFERMEHNVNMIMKRRNRGKLTCLSGELVELNQFYLVKDGGKYKDKIAYVANVHSIGDKYVHISYVTPSGKKAKTNVLKSSVTNRFVSVASLYDILNLLNGTEDNG